MKMTKIKHINIVHTKNYEWEVKLSMSDSVSTWICFDCGEFSYKALFVNSPETSMSGILEKVVGLYLDYLEGTKCTVMKACKNYFTQEQLEQLCKEIAWGR